MNSLIINPDNATGFNCRGVQEYEWLVQPYDPTLFVFYPNPFKCESNMNQMVQTQSSCVWVMGSWF
jgi:hypothetical protein